MPASGKQPTISKEEPAKRWRAKRYSVTLGPWGLMAVSLRRFRTRPKRRSDRYSQIVLSVSVSSIREVAIAVIIKRRRLNPTFLWLPRRIIKPLLVAMIVANGIALIILQENHANSITSLTPIPAPAGVVYQHQVEAQFLAKSKPLRLRIPQAGINTSLISLGRQADGTIELPKRFDIAGWYRYGPTPGELGPAVIVGHVDSYKGIAIFWHLHELKAKDIIEVKRADGRTVKFAVTKVKEVPQNHFPTKEVYGKINYAGIRLITCGGIFNHKEQHYSHNVIVYGRLVI